MQKMKKTIESTGTEFLICFTSRPSSSSSKTLMSPNHPSSLSSSLSRRLRTSGSLKAGAASPMFPSSSRRRSGAAAATAIDAASAAEPSSPKVTCIGQVKIKAKKKGKSKKKIVINRSRSVRGTSSCSSSNTGLRKTVSICDALNCFVPSCAWSSCYSGAGAGASTREHDIVARKDGRIGKFVGLIERREEKVLVFEEKEEREEEVEVEGVEGDKGRVGVCIPPRNALLLMRCRSDPVRMAALSSRFWDSPAMRVQVEDEDDVDAEEKEGLVKVGETCAEEISDVDKEVEKGVVVNEDEDKSVLEGEEEEKIVVIEEDGKEKEVEEKGGGEVILGESAKEAEKKEEETVLVEVKVEEEELKEEVFCEDAGEEVEIILRRSISCSAPRSQDFIKAKEVGKRRSFSYRETKEKRRHSFSTEKETRRHSFCSEKEARRSSLSIDREGRRRWSFSIEREDMGPKEKPIVVQSVEPIKKEEPVKGIEPKIDEVRETFKVSKVEEAQVVVERERKIRELPDCLLLMMYEPKLSMEVSKETWVCSTDFVHWRPHQANQPTKPKVEERRNENKDADAAANAIPTVEQTPAEPTQAVSPIEQKEPKSSAVGALPQVPYERHFVLTRCKSEPVKSSARLVPDTCFWKSRHQPISTAGIGF